ncbi:ATP-binding protein [Maricaulaceae bacterium MS644]
MTTAHDEQGLKREGSLAARLVLVSLGWALVLLVAGAIALTALFRQTVLNDLDDRLARVTESLIAQLDLAETGLELSQRPTDPSYRQAFSGRYWQISRITGDATLETLTSASLADETLTVPDRLRAGALAEPGAALTGEITGADGERLRMRVRALMVEGSPDMFVFAAAEDRRPADRRVNRFAAIFAGLFAAFALLLLAGVYAAVRIGLSPVLRMGRAVAAVRDGEEGRITGSYPGELIALAGELNALLDHSREVVERARTHVGNLAHALKTPITVLGNEARGSDGPLADLVTRQTRLMSDQVEHHLRRARAAANAKAIGARTPVSDVLNDLGRTLKKIYARRGVELDWRCPPGLVFRGERQDLEDLAGNLMDNACKWAAARVTVSAAALEDARLEIVVSDDGPGLSEAERKAVLARGVRLDEQAPGTGLGLSIVNDLARAYEGALELGEAKGGGLRARLVLPRLAGVGASETRR